MVDYRIRSTGDVLATLEHYLYKCVPVVFSTMLDGSGDIVCRDASSYNHLLPKRATEDWRNK